jgi:hypothetical protein
VSLQGRVEERGGVAVLGAGWGSGAVEREKRGKGKI